jgi:type III restriction enzyme
MMKFQFDATQQYQLDAVAAIADIFKGQQRKSVQYSVMVGGEDVGMLPGFDEFGGNVGNVLGITEAEMRANVREVQARNQIADSEANTELSNWVIDDPVNGLPRACPHFTVEMETGTGKTYVYLRTIMELSKKYGYRKFVVVVPSVAVREGTLKSIEQTKEHLLTLYNEPVDSFVYDSKNVNRLRQFASSNAVEIMVINIQAFVKGYEQNPESEGEDNGNVIYRRSDKLSGKRPIDFVHAARPIVIIDEPQSVDNTAKAKDAITQLNPLCTLRYSATHKERYNLMYVLDPIRAFQLKLVKQIVVGEVTGADEGNDSLVRVESVESTKTIRAKVAINVKQQGGVKEKEVWIENGDNLYEKSNKLPVYEQGFDITEISTNPDNSFVRLSNGRQVRLGQQIGGVRDTIWEQQIDQTVEHHFKKVLQCKEANLKVLSLFFIDKVAHYRIDPSDRSKLGKFGQVFEESFRKWATDERFKHLPLANLDPADVHEGYFSSDRKGFKDTKGETAADEDTYNLIMRDKERLLSAEVPLQFIFSHSALREGWDNPNVFQICTLNETTSVVKKRQEIGRGLRIPVNFEGKRVFDESLNKLTVVVNETYEEFCKKLQTEYQDDAGVVFGKITMQAIAHMLRTADGGNPLLTVDAAADLAREIKIALLKAGVIDKDDIIQATADPEALFERVLLPEGFEELRPAIQDLCTGSQISSHVKPARNMVGNKLKPEVLKSPEFKALWEKISPRTTYMLTFDTEDFVNEVIYRLKVMDPIVAPRVTIRTGDAKIDHKGIGGNVIRGEDIEIDMRMRACQDILAYLQAETDLTRASLMKILTGSKRLKEFFVNPQVFLDRVAEAIQAEMGKLIVAQGGITKGIKGIKYSKILVGGEVLQWNTSEFSTEDEVDIDSSVAVQKSIYERVVFDSTIEKNFAIAIDKRSDVLLFVKLPWWYKIDTPVGKYNPDWAIALKDGEVVYIVRETKGTTNLDKLPFEMEKTKVLSGAAHFQELGVNYKVVKFAGDVRAV